MKKPEFEAAYRKARRAAVSQAHARLQQASSAVVTTLLKIRVDPKARKDPKMRRLLVSRIIPRHAELPVRIGRLPISALADLDQAAAMTLQMATSGKISPSEARDLARLIETRRCVLKAQDLERRLNARSRGGGFSAGAETSEDWRSLRYKPEHQWRTTMVHSKGVGV